MKDRITLYRPLSQEGIAYLLKSGFKAFNPDLGRQNFFYPLTSYHWARRLAREWSRLSHAETGLAEFRVPFSFIETFERFEFDGSGYSEYRVPQDQMQQLNAALIEDVQLLETYPARPVQQPVVDQTTSDDALVPIELLIAQQAQVQAGTDLRS